MPINYALLDEELAKRASALTAGQASVPQWKQMQAQGLGTLGDIAGFDTSFIEKFEQEQQEKLSGFVPKHPERLLGSDEPFEWWKEKAALNSMNTIVPMMGIAIGTTMQAIPHPIAKALGTAINWATYATTYNANLADTLQEHEQIAGRKLSKAEQVKAAVVASGVTYLDMLAPIRGGAGISSGITKTFGQGGVKATRESLQKLVNTNRQSLLKSVGVGSKHLGQIVGLEMGTEAGQKFGQIATSVDPLKVGTTEGMQDILEESVVAGPVAGMVASPGSIAAGGAQNRELTTARRLARQFNAREKARVGMQAIQTGELGKLGIDEAADLVDIPEGKGFTPPIKLGTDIINKKIYDIAGFDTKKFATDITRAIAHKAPSVVLAARNRQTSGHNYAMLNDILQMFISPGDYSGETKIRNSFQAEKDNITGEILEDTSAVIDKLAKHRLFGIAGRTLDPDINKYLYDRLKGIGEKDKVKTRAQATAEIRKSKPGITKKELDILEESVKIFRKDLDKAFELMNASETGLHVAYRENYLHSPVSRKAVADNRQEFIDILYAATIAQMEKKDLFGPSEEQKQKTLETIEQIARDIVDGRDPTIASSQFLNKLLEQDPEAAEREGQSRKDFEKYRSKVWAQLPDKFREKDLAKILEQYLQRAGVRIASARTFGPKNANRLTGHIRKLIKDKAITKDEASHIWNMYDASHNVYKKTATEFQERWRKFSKLGTTIGGIVHLGLATFSSLHELVWIAERAGVRAAVGTIPKAWNYASRGAMRGLDKTRDRSEGARALARLGFNLNPEVNERLDQLFSTDRSQIMSGYFRSPFGAFLTQWTNFNRNIAAMAGQRMMNDYANNWQKKNEVQRDRFMLQLKEQGLTVQDWKQLMRAARDPKTGDVNINILDDKFLNTRMTKSLKVLGRESNEVRVRDIMMPWVHKIIEDVVVHPNPSNKPLWMSNPDFSMIAQLKTFPIVFGNTVVKRLLRKLNPKQCNPDFGMALSVIGAVVAAYAIAHIGEEMKAAIKQREPRELGLIGGANVTGLTGAFGVFSGGQFGDLSTSLMGPTLDGIVNKGIGDFLGPALGDGTIGEGVGNLSDSVSDGFLSAFGPIGLNIKGGLDE